MIVMLVFGYLIWSNLWYGPLYGHLLPDLNNNNPSIFSGIRDPDEGAEPSSGAGPGEGRGDH